MQVASGDFFDQIFEPNTAKVLKESTKVVFIDVDKETLEQRRKYRDGSDYNPSEYQERDRQEDEIIEKNRHLIKFQLSNPDGELEQTANKLINEILGMF